jgi:hypothetical protein
MATGLAARGHSMHVFVASARDVPAGVRRTAFPSCGQDAGRGS